MEVDHHVKGIQFKKEGCCYRVCSSVLSVADEKQQTQVGKVQTAVCTLGCVTPFKSQNSIIECMCVSCAHGCDSCPFIMIMDDANHKTEKISFILPTVGRFQYTPGP